MPSKHGKTRAAWWGVSSACELNLESSSPLRLYATKFLQSCQLNCGMWVLKLVANSAANWRTWASRDIMGTKMLYLRNGTDDLNQIVRRQWVLMKGQDTRHNCMGSLRAFRLPSLVIKLNLYDCTFREGSSGKEHRVVSRRRTYT